jgi:AmmeMemoRadiSam system protein B
MLKSAAGQVTKSSEEGAIRAIIVPHAGYSYCVGTAMHAFCNLDPSMYDRIFVIGPSHQISIDCCTIADATRAESPFGDIPFDTEACTHLLSAYPKLFQKLATRTAEIEHSMEMEFPLLKYVFGEVPFKIVPIMVGSINSATAARIAAALKEVTTNRTLYVISSDFCHWGRRFGFTYLPDTKGAVWERIEAMDREGAVEISSGDPGRFDAYLSRTGNTICGRWPISIMMHLFRSEGVKAEWPSYSQSSNIEDRSDSSVSYFAGIFRSK